MPTFEIPDGPTTIEAQRSGTAPAVATATYSVTNTSADTMDGRLGVRVSGASKDEWFSIDGNRERSFGGNETQTATVRVSFPPDTPAGEYPFRLRAIAVNDPDNDHAEGPMTSVKLGPGGGGKKSLLWLWILLALLAVAVIGGVAYFMLRQPAETETTPPPPPPREAVLDDAQALQLAERRVGEWVAAYSEKNMTVLTDLSDPPFYFHDGLLFSKAQIRAKYEAVLKPLNESLRVRDLKTRTVGDMRKADAIGGGESIIQSLRLDDDDIIVLVTMEPDGAAFMFRRSPTDVKLAGIWG